MARQEVAGITEEEVEERRHKYRQGKEERIDKGWVPSFDEQYCLQEIPRQPPDYDGPTRYCASSNVRRLGDSDSWYCSWHGGANRNAPDNLEKPHLASMKHGLYATREHVREDFDEKDRALYDWIIDTFSSAYDIDVESEPGPAYDLHRLAVEMVIAERGRGYRVSEGQVREEPVRNEEGRVVTDSSGEVVTEKSEHYLAQMMHRQDKKITDLEKELGITRKEKQRQSSTDNAIEAMKSFADLGSSFINREDEEYDPEEWDNESDN